MKPWLSEPRGRQLEAFVGVWGIKTSRYQKTDELVMDAAVLFGLMGIDVVGGPLWTVERIATEIEALGKKERSRRARENIHHIFTDDDAGAQVKPADGPITHEGLTNMMGDSTTHLVDGAPFGIEGELDIDPAKLLRKVVVAVINSGQASILYDFPDVLAFFGSRIPNDEVAA